MYQLLEYYGKWHGFKGRFAAMPAWARFVVGIAALPGILLVLLSILALLVSLVALFLPANLAYRVVTWLSGDRKAAGTAERDDGDTEFVAVQQGGGRDLDDEEAPEDGGVRTPVTAAPAAEVVDPDQRPRRQIEVKIVE